MTEPRKIVLVFLVIMVIGLIALAVERVMEMFGRWWIVLVSVSVAVLILMLTVHFARARDLGQWENGDPTIKEWYQHLMQPDNPVAPCCGESDAYWADSYEVKGDQYVAIITDARPDEPLNRKHVPIGTKFLIPNNKLKYDQSNPTGHGIIFLSQGGIDGFVYCYVAPGGV